MAAYGEFGLAAVRWISGWRAKGPAVAGCVAGTLGDGSGSSGPYDTDGAAQQELPASTRYERDSWDSLARTHNPEVVGSNPTPATRQNGSSDIVRGAVFARMVTRLVAMCAPGYLAL